MIPGLVEMLGLTGYPQQDASFFQQQPSPQEAFSFPFIQTWII